ncbi:MAG: peptidase and in, kexin, sedolisin [Thermoleophilia bacterium]|nr:peptidase and in, kexin, sedolisin [Thermoleophilia bacterium]
MITRMSAPTSATPHAAPAAPSPPVAPLSPPPATSPASDEPQVVPGQHIVVFHDEVTRDQQASLLQGFGPVNLEPLPLINAMLMTTSGAGALRMAMLSQEQRAMIRFAQPNYVQQLRGGSEAGGDPNYAKQYHLDNTGQVAGSVAGADVNAPEAWTKSEGAGVIVAVVDTNVDVNHPDIAANIWKNAGEVAGNGIDDDANGYVDDVHGWNFQSNDNKPESGTGTHGTHVAGIIAAGRDNGVGGVGVAPKVQVMPLAILGGGGTSDKAIKAFAYALGNGANVISNSWGNNTFEPALAEAVKRVTDAGVSVVVAAGNEGRDTGVTGSYPDNYAGSYAVAASDSKDARASYSNVGTLTVDVAAPGDKILSTVPGSAYAEKSGTSMSAPLVSALLALVKAKYPHLSMKQVEERVSRSVQTGGAAKVWNNLVASGGRVDADAALTPLAAPTAPRPTARPVAGAPVPLTWGTDLADGQRFQVEVSTNAAATSIVDETFEDGTSARAFRTAGDKAWGISDVVSKQGTKSFNVAGLDRGQQARLELTETITEPTQVSFDYRGGQGGELSFFVNRDLQFQPTREEGWEEFTTTLQPGTYTFTWLATGKTGATAPIAVDGLRIGSVSDATWVPVATTAPGGTSASWTPEAATDAAALRVRADNGRFSGDWVQGAHFPVAGA